MLLKHLTGLKIDESHSELFDSNYDLSNPVDLGQSAFSFNVISGTRRPDNPLDGTSKADLMFGGRGEDLIRSGDGNDLVYAGSQSDVVRGGKGNDALHGETGGDTLYGECGNDFLFGGEDDDTLIGGKDSDTLNGGRGDDNLWGDDRPTWGGTQKQYFDADVFVFDVEDWGDDKIWGFNNGFDLIKFGPDTGIIEVEDLMIKHVGPNTEIIFDYGGGQSKITLSGELGLINGDDFIFA